MHSIALTVAAGAWYTNGTVIGISGVAVGLIAILVAISLWHFGTPRAVLEYDMPTCQALVSGSPQIEKDDLKIYFRDRIVNSPFLATLTIKNTGHRDIRSEDFDQQRPIVFHLNRAVVDLLSSPDPDNKLFQVRNDDEVALLPTLIRRKQEITVNILLEGRPRLSCTQTLADVNVRPLSTRRKRRTRVIAGLSLLLIITEILGFTFGGLDILSDIASWSTIPITGILLVSFIGDIRH
jgi:hypothetical protein